MKNSKIVSVYIFGICLLVISVFLSLTLGAKNIALFEVINALTDKSDLSVEALIVRERIPRTLFAIIAGGALSVSGALMQSVTRNPIADPSILGVNMGASLFVVCGIAFFGISTYSQYIWFALFGAGLTSAFVYVIANIGYSGMTPIKLALAGACTGTILSSLVSAIILPRQDVMDTFRFWQVGSLSGATMEGIVTVIPFILIGLFIAMIFMPSLNAISLGDELATGLGVNVGAVRFFSSLSSVLLCGSVTAIAGPIGFIGLMIPHTVRMLFGSNLNHLIPLSMIFGSVLLTLADVFGRVIGAPSEIEVGIITAFFGAPVLILIARKSKVKL